MATPRSLEYVILAEFDDGAGVAIGTTNGDVLVESAVHLSQRDNAQTPLRVDPTLVKREDFDVGDEALTCPNCE